MLYKIDTLYERIIMKNIKILLQYSKNLNVLYVEDDLSLLQTTSELFLHYFNNIDIASNGQEGLDKYNEYKKANDDYYDLIITDINMPKLNGIDMSKEILDINAMQAIVITTAHNEVEYLNQAINLGINGFVTKPINNNQLIKVLHKACIAISDHKFVDSHIEIIETLNVELDEKNIILQKQNKELVDKNTELEKSFRMLDTMVHKEQLSHSKKVTEETAQNTADDKHIQEQIEHLIYDDLNELKELHSEIDLNVISILNSVDSIDIYALQNLIKKFLKYSTILSIYSFFDELGGSMNGFALTLKENPLPQNEESVTNIFMLLESFMYVLGRWQDDLSLGNANNINSLDASMISDMHTITNMWTQKEEVLNEDDLDDIFDF